MRVSGNSTNLGVARAQGDGKPAATPQALPASAPVHGDDAVVVSSSAQFIAIAQAQVSGIPDVRIDKVEALKALMDADDYNPDPEAVADGLVREHTPAMRE
jgi:negative regulator of flagellin synthesis FlgM